MKIKRCEFCNGYFQASRGSMKFCNTLCQRKDYNRRPEIKEKYRKRMAAYRQNNPEWKEKHRILAVTKYREKRREFWKEYGKRPEVRARIREKDKLRRQTDNEYAIADRLRRSLNHATNKYSNTGKVMSASKYGLDWEKIIESLKPFPKNIKNFEIDHIIPLRTFNLTDSEQVREAFSPDNLQWLLER